MADVSKEDMTKIMGTSLNLHGDLGKLGVKLAPKGKTAINGPTIGVQVEADLSSVNDAFKKIGSDLRIDEDKSGKRSVVKAKKDGKEVNPKASALKPGATKPQPASQKEILWKIKMEKLLIEIAMTKQKPMPVFVENLPLRIKEQIIKEAAIKGDANTPLGANNDQTAKKAGWTRNPWSASLKKAFERWGNFMEGPGIGPSAG